MSAALKLEVFQNGELLREIALDGEEISVGRGQNCAVRLDDRAISRKHAIFRPTAEGIEFEKQSRFGNIKVNGKDSDNTTLKVGDRMIMGSFELRVKQDGNFSKPIPLPPAPSTPVIQMPDIEMITKTTPVFTEVEVKPLIMDTPIQNGFEGTEGIEALEFETPTDSPIPSDITTEISANTDSFDFGKADQGGATRAFTKPESELKAVLEFSDGAANLSIFELTEKEIAIGRSQKCHVVLEDKRSSRKHSVIQRQQDKYFLKDLGSANGTLLNGLRIEEQELQSGDVIQIGDTQFVFKMVQADYEQKKDHFIPVQHLVGHEVEAGLPPSMSMSMDAGMPYQGPYDALPPPPPQPAPIFEAEKAPSKSFIGKLIDRYRAMNTKQQIIYGVVILAAVWYLTDEEEVDTKAKLNVGQSQPKVAQVKKGEKKPGSGQSFDNLTPEQQRYIETEYQLGFDLFKNREYDNALLEIGKIFSLVQDYKNAREIEAFAREGKRKLEAQEEERKKKEQERQAQLKLQSLLEQVGMLMDKKRFKEAEVLFPEIELIQPENAAVSEWRKQMVAENEKIEKEAIAKKESIEVNRLAWADYLKTLDWVKAQKYWDALDRFDEILTRPIRDNKLVKTVKDETKRVEGLIAAERDPLLIEAKALEQAGKLSEAYRAYQKAYNIDSTNTESPQGMKRIRGTLSARARSIYAEGVFAESYSDLETAEKRYTEVMDVVPNDDDYYLKAEKRLRRLTIFRRPAAASPEAVAPIAESTP